jgi:hypothetical protein
MSVRVRRPDVVVQSARSEAPAHRLQGSRRGSEQFDRRAVTAVLCGDLGGTNSRLVLYATGVTKRHAKPLSCARPRDAWQ